MRALALSAALLLAGCVTPIVNYDKMDAAQIAALVKDKTAAANCVVLNTPYGRGVSTYMALDKSVLEKGAILTIDEQCKMSLTQGQLAPTFQMVPVPVQPAPAIRPQSAPSSWLRGVLETSAQMQR